MLSMTGFGSQRQELDQGTLTVQVSAVNHRHCQVSVRSDARDLQMEEQMRKHCRQALKRGSISVALQWQPTAADVLPTEQLANCYRELDALARQLKAPAVRLELLAPWLQRFNQADDESLDYAQIEPVLHDAVDALQQMRAEEGARMADAFRDLHQQLRQIQEQMQDIDSGRVDQYRERLLERVNQVLADSACKSDDVIREVAVYADRIDISEELVRLASHLGQLLQLINDDSGEQQGKRLEFLLQECGREVNTVGSKAHDAELSQLVVDAKSVLEQMREQAANIL